MNWEFSFLKGLQELHHPVLNSFFETVTHLGDSGWFWIVLGIALLFRKKTRRCASCLLLALLIGALVCNVTLKPLVARQRPCWIDEGTELLIPAPQDFSFPSGHSQASFAAATVIFFFNKKWGVVFYILAALIALSRLYLYVHFPTDVLAGMVIGIFMGCLAKRLMEMWEKRSIRAS